MKFPITYGVQYYRAPGATEDTAVPVIIDRSQPVELAALLENCIDRGLVAGLKPTAVGGIAEGIAAQMAHEFSRGRSVGFGQYFYGRPYLSGTTTAEGRLTEKNAINVRLYKGNLFKLSLDDYRLTFEGSGETPKLDFVVDASTGIRGQVTVGETMQLNGRFLKTEGDTIRIVATAPDGTAQTLTPTFSASSENILVCTVPASFGAAGQMVLAVERVSADGTVRRSNSRAVKVIASGETPAPMITGGHSAGHAAEDQLIHGGAAYVLEGENLSGASVKLRYMEGGTEKDVDVPASQVTVTPGTVTVAWDAIRPALDAAAETVTFTVTTPGGTATYIGESSNE